jgi:antitoxin VapB
MTYIRSLHGRPDKDREADTVIRDLVERTGESMTDAVKRAVTERLQRVPLNSDEIAARKRKLADLHAYFDALPHINEHLSEDEVLGYDDNGLPR